MSVKDSSGREARISQVQNVSAVLEDGGTLRLPRAIVTGFPARFAENRVGGLVSPQLLAAPGEAAVLDLRVPEPELRFEPFAAAVARLGARRLPPDTVEICRSSGSLLYALRTRIGTGAASPGSKLETSLGSKLEASLGLDLEASLGLDTGAAETVLDGRSVVARGLTGLKPSGFSMGVTGVREPRFRSPAVAMDFGAGARSIPVDVGHAGASCGADGLLGLDAVRGCAFVLSDRSLAIACAPRRADDLRRRELPRSGDSRPSGRS